MRDRSLAAFDESTAFAAFMAARRPLGARRQGLQIRLPVPKLCRRLGVTPEAMRARRTDLE